MINCKCGRELCGVELKSWFGAVIEITCPKCGKKTEITLEREEKK